MSDEPITWATDGKPSEGDIMHSYSRNRILTYKYVSENWTLVAWETVAGSISDGDTVTFTPTIKLD